MPALRPFLMGLVVRVVLQDLAQVEARQHRRHARAQRGLGVPGIFVGVDKDGDVGQVVVEVVQVGQVHEGLAALVEDRRPVGRVGNIRDVAHDPQVGYPRDAETARVRGPRDIVLSPRREHQVNRDIAVAQRIGDETLT